MRTIIRSVLILVLVVVVAVVLLGVWTGSSWRTDERDLTPAVGTGGVDTQRAREIGADVAEKAAMASQQVKEESHDAAITTKIKAKMALDDLVKARSIHVTTEGSTVTLTGSVGSAAEHDRAVALARETAGVANVVDRLVIR